MACLLLGSIAGFLGGLMGIGGGVIIVPALFSLFAYSGWADNLTLKMAIATSLSAIIFTSIAAIRAQLKHKAILWSVVKTWTPAILFGSFCSGFIASSLPTFGLKVFIGCFLFTAAVIMLLRWTPAPHRQLPAKLGSSIIGLFAGMGSALAGIGGGNIIVPTLVWFNTPMKNATATSSALGLPIAFFGAAGFISAGWSTPNLPEYSLGYAYLPAVGLIAITTFVFAPLGVAMAHKISPAKLKQIFGLLLLLVSTRMLYNLL
jgi:uncharacterized membrane protein YfcA